MEGFAENLPKLRVVAVTEEPATVSKSRNLSVEPKCGRHPGRVMDHIEKGYLKLDHLQALVLDEADEMLSMGFIDDIKWILEHTPSEDKPLFLCHHAQADPKAGGKLHAGTRQNHY